MRHILALTPETGAEWPSHRPRPKRLFAHIRLLSDKLEHSSYKTRQ